MHLFQLDEGPLFEEAEKRFKELVDHGQRTPGVSDTIDPDLPPSWFDVKKFRKAQQVADKYYISIHASHYAGLLLVLQLPRGLAPLLANGNHASIPKLFRRYLSTTKHVKSWYETDIYDKTTPGYKSVRQVRAMHQNSCRVMNKKTNRVIGRDNIWVSQYDMALTQWAFIGLVVLFPHECGLHTGKAEDMELIVYFWRVIGHVMGIEDRFNLCAGNYDQAYVYFKLVLDQVYRPALASEPHAVPTGFEMTKGLVRSLRCFNYSVRWQVMMKYWYEVLELPSDAFRLETRRMRFRFKMMKFSMGTVLKSQVGHVLYKAIFKTNQKIQHMRQDTIERKLKEQFPDAPYSKCPYNIDLDQIHLVTI